MPPARGGGRNGRRPVGRARQSEARATGGEAQERRRAGAQSRANRTGPDRTGPDRTGAERSGPDRSGPDRIVGRRDYCLQVLELSARCGRAAARRAGRRGVEWSATRAIGRRGRVSRAPRVPLVPPRVARASASERTRLALSHRCITSSVIASHRTARG